MNGPQLLMQEVARRGLMPAFLKFNPNHEPAGSSEGGQFSSGSGGSGDTGPTGTPEFKAWFRDSKVVDKDGKPLVVYHGTSGEFTEFRTSTTGEFGPGIYFTTSAQEAGEYSRTNTIGALAGPNVMPVYLSLQNPYTVTSPAAYWERFAADTDQQAVEKVMRAGHDGIAYARPGENKTYYVAFRPTQIKSAVGNTGTFSPHDPHIGKSLGSALLLKEVRARELWPQYLERLKFNEDQPRDDHGRWTDESGGSFADQAFFSDHVRATVNSEESKISEQSIEYGVFIDPRDGRVSASFTNGKPNYIELPNSLIPGLENKIFIHNHPGGNSLSKEDAQTAQRFNMLAIRAVAPGGSTYMLMRTGPTWPDNFQSTITAIDQVQHTQWKIEIDRGMRDVLQANATHHDELWKKVAKQFPGEVTYVKKER